jgi:AraC-like DNA-binding protein
LVETELNNQGLSVLRLAEEIGISPSRLRQLFVAELGNCPNEYIRGRRLDQARVLLATSSLSVKEVMAAVGFNDPSHFSKEFKKRFGVAPSTCKECFYTSPQCSKRE